jgi:23S rRNA (guanine2445-N2)-methyltransferase / 23S rRNA (guanine2069-N7)-methyltransferase
MEDILADELQGLGARKIKQTLAGVSFEGSMETAYRACLWSRVASRILMILDTFQVETQEDLYRGVQRTDWSRHLDPRGSFAVTFNTKSSRVIKNTHFGSLKVKDAVVDQMRCRFGKRPDIDRSRPDIRINLYLDRDKARLSLDLSGESLHRRGYRDINIKAPMKENLAAAVLIRSGWPALAKNGGVLVDPMCGSGTLLIEGALMALDQAPGLLREYFGFKGWKNHDPVLWNKLIREAENRKYATKTRQNMIGSKIIAGFDQDLNALKAAKAHVENAGLQNLIHLEQRNIEEASPLNKGIQGLIISNPPYGERMGEEPEIADLYMKYGEVLKANFKHWQAALIISKQELGFKLGIRSRKPATFFNGAIECKLLRMKIEETEFLTPRAEPNLDPKK